MSDARPPAPHGRGAHINPPNRFIKLYHEPEPDAIDADGAPLGGPGDPPTEYFVDHARSAVTENDSPDVGFRFSINPYRGCSHGCVYCYARPTHEYLGRSAGLDFETKIFVKRDAPALFRTFLMRERWQPEPIALSGVTDPYQPAERHFRLTRGCLEVAAEFRQPLALITKSALILHGMGHHQAPPDGVGGGRLGQNRDQPLDGLKSSLGFRGVQPEPAAHGGRAGADVPKFGHVLRGGGELIAPVGEDVRCLSDRRVQGVGRLEEPEQDARVGEDDHQSWSS